MLPTFLGIGAGKCGTSWIAACLKEHPQIFMPEVKEVKYFSDFYEEGQKWYEEFFPGVDKEKVVGEYSTTYLFSPQIAERIYRFNPQIKLIACFRNPIDRAWSHFRYDLMDKRVKAESKFKELIEEKDYYQKYIESGFYFRQIKPYLDRFPAENILLLIYEDIAKSPLKFMQRVYQFLGVDPLFVPSKVNQRVKKTRVFKENLLSKLVHRALDKVYGEKKHRQIVGSQNTSFIMDSIMRIISKPINITPEIRKKLLPIFFPENRKLEKVLNRNLSFWNQ